MTEGPYHPEEKILEAPRARNRFVLFTLLGALGVVIGAIVKFSTSNGNVWPYVITIGAPLLCICLHAWITLRNDEKYARSANFADMTYYMGFLFTLWTLVVAMFSYIFKEDAGVGLRGFSLLLESLPEFGAAIISTIVGMIWRLYLTGFEEERDEFQDQSVAILNSQTRLLDTLRQEVSKIIEGIQTASRDWKQTLEKSSEDTKRIFEETAKQFQGNMDGSWNKIKETLDGFASELGTSTQTLAQTAAQGKQKVEGAFEQMVNTIGMAAQQTAEALLISGQKIGDSAGHMARGFDEAQWKIQQETEQAMQKIVPLKKGLDSLRTAADSAGAELEEMAESIHAATEKIREIEAVDPGLAARAAEEYVETLRNNTNGFEGRTREIHELAERIRGEAHDALTQVEETSRRLSEAQVPERLGQSLRDAQNEADRLREKIEKAAKKSPKTLWERIKAVFAG
ncbi:MAG: hypothetical protein OXU92_05890 [Deltaproteobacteria bacterium]|nr:hypothetical protein [Deltaproteobacteria bacterium]